MMLNGWYDYLFGSTTTTPAEVEVMTPPNNNIDNKSLSSSNIDDDDESQENVIVDATALDAIASATALSAANEIQHHQQQKHHHRAGCNHKILAAMAAGGGNVGDEDWIFVDDGRSSGRSSPVLVANPEIVELDDGTSSIVASIVGAVDNPTTTDQCVIGGGGMATSSCNSAASVEQLRAVRALAVQRRVVADKLFSAVVIGGSAGGSGDTSGEPSSAMITSIKVVDKLPHARLKRVTLANVQQSPNDVGKTKSRSKKYKQLQAGRNNDRKCQY